MNETTNDNKQSPEKLQDGQGGNRDIDKQGEMLCSTTKSTLCYRYFSMFTGVGGFELGLENAGSATNLQGGWNENSRSPQSLQSKRDKSSNETSSSNFRCVGFSEIDKYANQLLTQKFPNIPNFGDCTKIEADKLPEFDMLCGGFPCQSFSIAGKRRGFQDTRGTMFFHIARILEVKRPKIVFLENVKGLLNHNKGETFKVIIQTLSELGYDVQWMVLNSKFFGVPQNRERVFIIGSLRGTSRPEILPFGEINSRNDAENCSATITSSYKKGCNNHNQLIMDKEINGENKMRQINPGVSDAQRIFTTDGIGTTLKGLGGGQGAKTGLYLIAQSLQTDGFLRQGSSFGTNRPQSSRNIRRLTPVECERLQGFPDGWTEGFSDTQRYKMMGNAVTVNVIKAIGEKLCSVATTSREEI